jgi:hypothetical protein
MASGSVSAYRPPMMPNVTMNSANLVGAACGVASGAVALSHEQWWWAALWVVLTAALVVEGVWRGRKPHS